MEEKTGPAASALRDVVAPTLGMACFWAFLRYPVCFGLLYPVGGFPEQASGGMAVAPFATFLAALAALSLCGLAWWRPTERVLAKHRAATVCCAFAGALGMALTYAARQGLDGPWVAPAVLAAAPFVALGFLACLLMWGSYFARAFGPVQLLVCALSYFVSLMAIGPTYQLAPWVAPAAVMVIPAGSALGWLAATGGPAGQEDSDEKTAAAAQTAGLRGLVNPTIWLFAAFLLAGSVVRGIVDVIDPNSGMRFQLSAPITALLVVACALFAWTARRGRDGAHDAPREGAVTQFTLGCWVAFSMLFFAGVFVFLALGNLDLGGNLVVVARSMLEIAFWILLCDLASRRNMAPVPLFLACEALVETASWASSYLAVPLILSNTARDPGASSTILALFATFSLTGVVTLILGFALVALGRRRATIAANDWLPVAAPGNAASGVAAARAVDEGSLTEGSLTDEALAVLLEQQHGLTPREALVAVGYAHGFSLAKVSESLGITTAAAQTHIKSAYRKLGVHSKDALIEVVDGLRREGQPGYNGQVLA